MHPLREAGPPGAPGRPAGAGVRGGEPQASPAVPGSPRRARSPLPGQGDRDGERERPGLPACPWWWVNRPVAGSVESAERARSWNTLQGDGPGKALGGARNAPRRLQPLPAGLPLHPKPQADPGPSRHGARGPNTAGAGTGRGVGFSGSEAETVSAPHGAEPRKVEPPAAPRPPGRRHPRQEVGRTRRRRCRVQRTQKGWQERGRWGWEPAGGNGWDGSVGAMEVKTRGGRCRLKQHYPDLILAHCVCAVKASRPPIQYGPNNTTPN